MFEFLFKYPAAVFAHGQWVLLGAWPLWLLAAAILASAAGLGWLLHSRLAAAAPAVRNWRAALIWALQALMAALLLLLLWQPAIAISELQPQQNIVAVLIDDSRSMAIADTGAGKDAARETQAVNALQAGTLAALQKKFQVRLYRFDSRATRIDSLDQLQPAAPATRIGSSLEQLSRDTADLPLGAVVLLSDGSDNSGGTAIGSGGIAASTIASLRARRIPVHTVGFGEEQSPNDIEIDDAALAPRALADSRVAATVTFHQRGHAGQKSTLTVTSSGKVLAARPVTFASDGATQTETVMLNVGPAGAKTLQFSLPVASGESNAANNSFTRLMNVESATRRILYIEGDPRWEYKFIRRAEEGDHDVQIASMLRTTENKLYRQGINSPSELADGFPSRPDELFGYQGLIIGSVEAGYFTPIQQQLIHDFVDRRGGGLLLLGGRSSLGDGGWAASSLADLLPVTLPAHTGTFQRDPAVVSLTASGANSIITRLVNDPAANAARWMKMPQIIDYQDPGTPKPGANVLAEMTNPSGRKMPLLITQNFGLGRTAVLATSGTWRWQMVNPLGDPTHDVFWQQLLRWLVSDSPGHVTASVPNQILFDDGQLHLTSQARDSGYLAAPDAHVEAHILGPNNVSALVPMNPVPDAPGQFQADWTVPAPGAYLTEVTATRGGQELGRDVLTFQRLDGVAENFHTGQNRPLLERLAQQTGGEYWRPQDLAGLPASIPYSQAGVTMRQTKELWDMPIVFLLLLLLPVTEWLLRRRWGIV